MWSSFLAVFKKEFIHIRRDRSLLAVTVMVPLLQLILFGFLDQTVRNLPTVVVDQDHSSYSRELMDKINATSTFKITRVAPSTAEAREDIVSARARVGVVIPPDYGDKRSRAQEGKILVLIDGSDSQVSAQALAAVNGIAAAESVDAFSRQLAAVGQPSTPALSVQPTLLFNPEGRTANYIIPGLLAVMLQLVAVFLTAIAIVRERERGTLEQLLVMPLDPLGLMLGKIAPYLFVSMGELVLVLGVMRIGFGVEIRGNLFFLFFMGVVYLFALLALGIFISTKAPSQAVAQQQAQLFLLPSMFLSGYIFPTSTLPPILLAIGQALPATQMIAILRGVILRDAGPLQLLPNVLALGAISVALIWFSARRFRNVTL